MAPRHTGREGRHDRGRNFQRPIGPMAAQRLRKLPGLGVPSLGSAQVEEGSRCKVADEGFDGRGADGFVTIGGGGHAPMIPRPPAGMQAYRRIL